MRLMTHATVQRKPDNALVLPPSITSGMVNGAVLPIKIEHARKAIAECTDLSELLRYKSQAEGLAAAVRTIKEVGPELIRKANELVADAWRKGGELLKQYSGHPVAKSGPGRGKVGKFSNGGSTPSPRRIIADQIGLAQIDSERMVRIASAPKELVYNAVKTSQSLQRVSKACPAVGRNAPRQSPTGEPYKRIMGGHINGCAVKGLSDSYRLINQISRDNFKHLTPDERKVVKAKITEIMELLDEMDRLCR